jgi:hypothetical protein
MSLLTRNFHKFLKSSKKYSRTSSIVPTKRDSHGNSRGKYTKDKKDKNNRGIQYYECLGYGHVRVDCGNLKNSKGNAMNASVNDESESTDSQNSKSKKMVYMAFSATVKNVDAASISSTLNDGESCDDSSQGEFDYGQGL